ncbi:hypothetical protein GWO43_01855 [candidate division KSB1 bacterium]|nr:hypothetical protein [candidate division KSB1 bacterium]NIR69469.1 hypothetical protein [candidate division KSB1 bacterium]NIS22819.1 hypothetical protein [candidate division KSB1 bacterium]NIT69659.1 hypothetical protein [candidate division KSB1 bacterium]NIU23328.1 hypothetical protein [candidate division KSB1 bacterium]
MQKFRRKYFNGRCPKCNRPRKLTLIGEDEDVGVVWLRCNKCLETHSYAVERLRKTGRVLTKSELKKRNEAMSEVAEYTPDKTYWIGQKIHHPDFDEVGEIVKKEETSGKNQMIIVEFENQGTKKLVEGFNVSA